MWKRLIGVGSLLFALTLMAGGAGVSARGTNTAPDSSIRSAYSVGAGLDAGTPYLLAAPATQATQDPACAAEGADTATGEAEDPNDTDNLQDENGAEDATEANGEQEAANDPDNVQDENGADDATENPNDTDNLQCGDQQQDATGGQPSGQQAVAGDTQQVTLLRAQTQNQTQATDGTETESDAEQENGTEAETGGDEAVDGIQCEQQGEHEGENAGC